MKTKFLPLFTLSCAVSANAAPRHSTDYAISTDTADSGGARSTSTSYTHDGSLGGVGGVSAVTAPAETAKHGYIGQLYEVTGLVVSATPASINETTIRQLAAWQELDDDSDLAVSAAAVAWTVVSGPLTGISAAGLATAGTVYQDTSATVQGSFAGLNDSLDLTVLDTLPDNYGSYAGDRLDDSWQYEYFGLNNPLAGPLMDPDGDSQNNRFEFTAGLIPTNPLSRFLLRVEPIAGEPEHKRLVFSPLIDGRSYDILTSTTLLDGGWSALTGGIVSENGEERTVTDPEATEGRKFYRVEITKP